MASLSGDSSSMFQNRLSGTPEHYIEVCFCGGSLLRATTACAFSATTSAGLFLPATPAL